MPRDLGPARGEGAERARDQQLSPGAACCVVELGAARGRRRRGGMGATQHAAAASTRLAHWCGLPACLARSLGLRLPCRLLNGAASGCAVGWCWAESMEHVGPSPV